MSPEKDKRVEARGTKVRVNVKYPSERFFDRTATKVWLNSLLSYSCTIKIVHCFNFYVNKLYFKFHLMNSLVSLDVAD